MLCVRSEEKSIVALVPFYPLGMACRRSSSCRVQLQREYLVICIVENGEHLSPVRLTI